MTAYLVTAYLVTAYLVTAYLVTAYLVTAYLVTAYLVTAYLVTAYLVTAYLVTAWTGSAWKYSVTTCHAYLKSACEVWSSNTLALLVSSILWKSISHNCLEVFERAWKAIAKRAWMARLLSQLLRNRFPKDGGNQMRLNSRLHMRF